MAQPEDAAEYVLGTLDAGERAGFETQLASDAALQAEVAAWQRRLAPLDDETAPAEPPSGTFAKILDRIGAAPGNVVVLEQRVRAWRRAALAVSAMAAVLIVFFTLHPPPAADKGFYVAVLAGDDHAPAFVAAVDVGRRVVVVRRVGAPAPSGRSYELWALGAGRGKPQPLGVVDAALRLDSGDMGAASGTTLAISLEPEGGSPTGAPTGPVLFTGALLAAE